jgi:hypothetical protein
VGRELFFCGTVAVGLGGAVETGDEVAAAIGWRGAEAGPGRKNNQPVSAKTQTAADKTTRRFNQASGGNQKQNWATRET